MLGGILRRAKGASAAGTRASSTRIAVVGSGPSGFYSAKYLLKELPSAHVDVLDALPNPYGLVRSGVAPDHLEVKQVTNDFEEVAGSARFGFLGNVCVGRDVSVAELQGCYDAVVFAYGASSDRDMGVPGEGLSGVCSARTFVNWYNGHPDFVGFKPNLDTEDVVIVGQGNVAIDCARILCKTPRELAGSDIAAHAAEALARSRVRRVHVVGRRGHVQAAMTMKELREVTRLEDARFEVLPEELAAGRTPASAAEMEAGRARKRMDALLAEEAAKQAAPHTKSRALSLRFLLSPTACLPSAASPSCVGGVELERTRLEGPAEAQKAVATGVRLTLPAGLVLKSIGYKSLPIPGLPFNARTATVPNAAGRVLAGGEAGAPAVRGLYCTGWVKRGPSGIIGTNITDAKETVACVLEDAASGAVASGSGKGGMGALKALLGGRGRGVGQSMDWGGWLKVNAEEVARGAGAGKPREKVTSVAEMLAIGGH